MVRGRKVMFTAEGAGDAEGAPTCRWGGANRVAAHGSIPDTAFTMKSMKGKILRVVLLAPPVDRNRTSASSASSR